MLMKAIGRLEGKGTLPKIRNLVRCLLQHLIKPPIQVEADIREMTLAQGRRMQISWSYSLSQIISP